MTTSFDRSGFSEEAFEPDIKVFAEVRGGESWETVLERRVNPRIAEPFPARAWAVDAADEPFNLDCVIDNISSSGIFLRMPREMKLGANISLVVQLLIGPSKGATTAVYGTVLRDEPNSDGQHGIAISIKKHKFL
jgi:PilZ domain